MPVGVPNLFHRARQALGVTQLGLAEKLGASRRTGQRWDAGHSYPAHRQLVDLAKAVYKNDPELAAEIALSLGTSVVALGLVPSAPPPVAPPPIESIVDSIVCAAAEAIDVLPRAVRPALVAAFARARELQLTVEVVEKGLQGKALRRNSAKTDATPRDTRKGGLSKAPGQSSRRPT
jgi:transcriptional regulator with XRE-family HTH domain